MWMTKKGLDINIKSNTIIFSWLQPEGDMSQKSETGTVYQDNHATRPTIHKLRDHSSDVQPEGNMDKQ